MLSKGADVRNRGVVSAGMAVLAGTVIILMHCANPVDDPPLRWRSKVEAPITNEKFLIGEELDNLFEFEDVDILNVVARRTDDPTQIEEPDTIEGDTVLFSIFKKDTSSFESHEDLLGDKEFNVILGAIPISGAPVQRDTLPVPPAIDTFEVTLRVPLQKVYSIGFYDTSANVMRVTVANLGSSTLTDVAFGIAGVDTSDAVDISAGDEALLSVVVRNRSVNDSVDLYLAGISNGSAGQSVEVEFSVNGLYANLMRVDKDLVNFTAEFVNDYDLTDTVQVDYIDIGDGFFRYGVSNYTDLDLYVQGIHEHMWTTPFCEQNGFTRFEDMEEVSKDDSDSYFLGNITNALTVSEANTEQDFSIENLSSCRLFSEWDSSEEVSVTRVRYIVSAGPPRSDTVTVSASDSLMFTISTGEDFKFKEMMGTLTESYERQADTQMVPINLPWNESKASLRGNFILSQVWSDVRLDPVVPERAFIDTLRVDFVAYAPELTTIRDSTPVSLENVSRDSSYLRSIDITDVANAFSDSVAIAVKVFIPAGTRMRVVNDLTVHDPDYDRYIGRMIIHVNTSYRLNAKLDWTIDTLVGMDLGTSRFPVPEAMRYFGKLEDRRAIFEMWLRNSSSLNLSLLTLVAPDTLMDTLDSLTYDEVSWYLLNEDAAETAGYVCMFGDTGVTLPPRDAGVEQHNVVLLDNDQMETLLTADSLNFRWWIWFNEQERDALSDTDYVDMRSRLGIEGINNTDSLIIWE